jgi:glycosyltransferase involved in cell wall biosynthesis
MEIISEQSDHFEIDQNDFLSILVPVYNEEECIEIFYHEITSVLKELPCRYEIMFVNDGSTDDTIGIIKKFSTRDKSVKCIDLARNFGKEIAMAAGMDYISGDAVIIIDADLQDPPSLIPEMLKYWKEGFDDVYAVRETRVGESFTKKISSALFYRVLSNISNVEIQIDTGDFRLLSKKAINTFRRFRDKERYTKGIFSLLGRNKKMISYNRNARIAGKTKWNYFKLIGLAINGITSFTTKPLRLATIFGLIISLIAFAYTIFIVIRTIIYGDPVVGYPSLISIVMFIGGIQLFFLGIIGEYLGKVYIETKDRPMYVVNEFINREEEK